MMRFAKLTMAVLTVFIFSSLISRDLLAQTSSISGLKSALDQPEFATAIGLVRFGSFQAKKRAGRGGLTEGIKSRVSQILRAVKK